jgi:cytochrome c biogenesis protein CcmG/thiol:disulfide interchange protein DsbE
MKFLASRKIFPLILFGLGLTLIGTSIYFILQNTNIAPQTDVSAVPAKISFPPPKLTLTDIQGVSHSLADYRGQIVLVNLWATWCPPCKEEMPTLQAFYDEHKRAGFEVIAINDGDPTADVLQFVKDYKLAFSVWLDPTYNATERVFKTLNLPTSYVLDRTGKGRFMWVGAISRKMLDQYVAPLITEQQ